MTDTRATQVLAEHWIAANADAQATQVAVEHWASVASGTVQALATFVALEHWASVDLPASSTIRVMVLA